MSTTESNLNVGELADKVSSDMLLEAITDVTGLHNMWFAGDSILAVGMSKDTAITHLINAMKEAEFNVVSIKAGFFLCTGPDVYAQVVVHQRSKYSTIYAQYWCSDVGLKKDFETWLNKQFQNRLIKGTICGLRWVYATKHGLGTNYIEELLSDVVVEEAYPSIIRQYGSLKSFAATYIEGDESILLLQGPPGTGKSRLIRYLMTQLVEMKKVDKSEIRDEYGDIAPGRSKSLVLYTSDTDSLKGDELFAHFMTSDELMFVVEDADNMLRSRQSGNDHLHRFLTISDGIIRNVGRKVVFTTNLANMNDVDDALIRPGRCFAALSLGGLDMDDSMRLIEKLCPDRKDAVSAVATHFKKNKTMTLAEAYKLRKDLPK